MSSTILFHITFVGKSMMERAGIASVASIKSVSSSKVSLGKAEVTATITDVLVRTQLLAAESPKARQK